MLYRPHLLDALSRRRREFARFEREWRDHVASAAQDLRALGQRSAGEIRRALERATKAPGALPSVELDAARGFVMPFNKEWRSHEEARRWATEVLRERTTFAADGSQILPGREISLPVAAVQAAAFENPHTTDGQQYRKEIEFEIITPKELLEDNEQATAAEIVNWQRFQLETKLVEKFLIKQSGWQERGARMPLAFFDGTLLISYATPRNAFQQKYVDESVRLIQLSRETRVPLVGFIDQSLARDLIRMLEVYRASVEKSVGKKDALEEERSEDLSAPSRALLYDAQLLRAEVDESAPSLLQSWGDRTVFCECLRYGLTEDFRDEDGEPMAGFVYLQTTGEQYPARLDVPKWIYDAGWLDETIDTVRAECVVGNGYPYAIETADAAAVLSARDREPFMRAVQEFAAREGLPFAVARKAISKNRRR
jgi:hypothetical protein